MDDIIRQWQDAVVAAQSPLRLCGGDSKSFYGEPSLGELFDTRAYRGVIDYEPSELVVTARCGTPLAELEAALADHGQMLAFEPPHFGAGATLGGCIATGLSGPRRASAGAARDFVLGTTLLDGSGRVLRFGGQVMKNVAGFDVSRLLVGSLGTLGLIAEVSLKVLPLPGMEVTLQLAMNECEAHIALARWIGENRPISASCWYDGVLSLRLSGATTAIAPARERIGGEVLASGEQFWREVREQQHFFFSGDAPLWRISLPALAAPLNLPGATLIEWFGAQRWVRGSAEIGPDALRARVAALGGHATLFRDSLPGVQRFQSLSPALQTVHARLKAAFDPRGIFNPGRMYAGL
ncbi:MAG: glycolate oxidase subunit GlcE [Rhodocyclaceae bacterium]|nr:glycolate oxidase subunit GlcE [Rhodocyclaceae bacterium]